MPPESAAHHRDDEGWLGGSLVRLGTYITELIDERVCHRLERMERELHHLIRHSHEVLNKQEQLMSDQAALDAKVAEVTATLTTQFAEVQAEIQALKDQVAAGATIDLSSFGGLDAAVQSVSDAVPDAPVEQPPVEQPPA